MGDYFHTAGIGRHWVTEIIHKVIPALHDPGDTRVYVFKPFRLVLLN